MRSTLNKKDVDEDEINLEWEAWGWGSDLPWMRKMWMRLRMISKLNKNVEVEDDIYLTREGWG